MFSKIKVLNSTGVGSRVDFTCKATQLNVSLNLDVQFDNKEEYLQWREDYRSVVNHPKWNKEGHTLASSGIGLRKKIPTMLLERLNPLSLLYKAREVSKKKADLQWRRIPGNVPASKELELAEVA